MCVPVRQCQLWRGAHCRRGENIKLFGHRAVLSDVSGGTGAESLQCAAKVHRSISVNKQDHRDTDQALGPRITPEGLGDGGIYSNTERFAGIGATVASFVSTECPIGRGMWGTIGKPLKRAIWNTLGLHAVCCTTCLRLSSVLGQCRCCSLPLFVNRQPPCMSSCTVLLLPPMHHRNLWGAKERALGV